MRRIVMAPYLPQSGMVVVAIHTQGGALYALGLIHANHGEGIKQFLRDSLCDTNIELLTWCMLGSRLGDSWASDEDIYDVKPCFILTVFVLWRKSLVSVWLLDGWAASLALGIALTVYGREEEADTLIEQMTRDQDPILRYGGSKPKSKPKKEKTEEERKFRRRAKYFLVTQLVVVLVFLSLLGGSDDAEVEVDDDDSLNYND
ncbi:hypothetical protein LOK49_LG07G01950 [Camellia lanceoleosa]|uniref:Uncharacterized protein n=1 Tax=Camellia lanceoleosa TaxID=1840588 RepID=A0ACC0H203_9ERIC|nr:hypothetical protein LOK49_LG07G01950 [Camellia lanceoleosa]